MDFGIWILVLGALGLEFTSNSARKYPVLHLKLPIGHVGEVQVVGNDDEGLTQPGAKTEKEFMQVAGILGIQVSAWLVCQDHVW